MQFFLNWVKQKSCSVVVTFNQAAVRAFYFYFALKMNEVIFNLNPNPVVGFFGDDFTPDISLCLGLELTEKSNKYNDIYLDLELAKAYGDAPTKADVSYFILDIKIKIILEKLASRSLDHYDSMLFLHDDSADSYEDSWQYQWANEIKDLAEQLRPLLIKYRNIGHDWKFTDQQRNLLQQYYDTNKLLVDCLNQASPEVRSHIEDTLLLPIGEIEKRQLKE